MTADATSSALIARLWRDFVKARRGDVLALAPFLILVAVTGTLYAFIAKSAIDALSARDAAVIVWAPLAVLAASATRGVAIFGQALLSQRLGLKVLRDLQKAMFAKLVRADFARFAGDETGSLVSRFTNDINVVSEGLVRAAQAVMRDALTVLGALASMFYFDWMLALYVVGVFAFAGPPLAFIARRARKRTQAAQQQLGAVTAMLTESLSNPRFVRTYALEAHETERAETAFEMRRKLALKLVFNRAWTDPLLEALGGVALGGVLAIAGLRILAPSPNHMTIGDLWGIITAIGVATPAARALGTFNTVMNEALAALSRVFALLDETPRVVNRPDARPAVISRARVAFENVSFAYGRDGDALTDVSFAVEKGSTVALVGASGAGKSTVFNLIPRLYDVNAGSVSVDGQDIRTLTLESLRANIALVSQDVALFHDTIGANIALGRPGASRAEIIEAAKAAAAHDFICAMPNGYDANVGERGGMLSGGERQRVALARAFLRDAPILLLDEATSALDAESERKVQDALARLARGRTTLVIAHRLSTVRDADNIVVFEAGRIRESGRHAQLIAQDGLYAALRRIQFQTEAV